MFPALTTPVMSPLVLMAAGKSQSLPGRMMNPAFYLISAMGQGPAHQPVLMVNSSHVQNNQGFAQYAMKHAQEGFGRDAMIQPI